MKVAMFVDVQKDFIDGTLGSLDAQSKVKDIISFAKWCRNNGFILMATQDTHNTSHIDKVLPDGTKHYIDGYMTTLEGQKLPVEHCIQGTEGWRIVPELLTDEEGGIIIPKSNVIRKHTFGNTTISKLIINQLKETYEVRSNALLPEEIYICGFCTDVCVVSNALILRARMPDTPIKIISNLCAGTTFERHEAALKVLDSCQCDIIEWNQEQTLAD